MSDSDFEIINFLKKKKAAIAAVFVFLWALLPSLGIGFQNATAIVELLNGATNWLGEAILGGAIVGGICSTIVNHCLNFDLLKGFSERISGRKSFAPHFSKTDHEKKFRYWLGVFVFVVTGILFGMTAFSVGASGGLAIAAMVAGVFVALVTIPQELETWLESFDDLVAVAIGRRKYDIEQLENTPEDDAKIPGLLANLQKEIKDAILKKELKKLRERLAQEAEDEKNRELKRSEVTSIDEAIWCLEKNQIDLEGLITLYSGKDQVLKDELDRIRALIETEQDKIELLKKKGKNAIISALKKFKKAVEENQPKTSLIDGIKMWWRDLTPGRFIGLIISVGNVLALSLLFTIGLTTFLTTIVGVAAFPALIIGFSVAFTFGAFTEFYFYHYFLADFCDRIADKWSELMASPNWGLGIATVVVNATVNGVLAYFGVILLGSLLAAAGIAAPPLLILAVVSAVFAGVASLLLGSDFWIKSAEGFFNWGSTKEPAEGNINTVEDNPEMKLLVINDEENKKEIKKPKINISQEACDRICSPLTKRPQFTERKEIMDNGYSPQHGGIF